MAARKRTQTERENDLVLISSRYLMGHTQDEIALALDLSRQQVCYDLRTIQRRWQDTCARNLTEARGRELAEIDRLERAYWDAWLKSVETKTVKSYEETDKGEKKSVKQEERDGNPTFLAGVRWCIERRCKLLGLDSPEKCGPDGSDDRTAQTKNLSLEELEELEPGELAKIYGQALRQSSPP